MPGCIFFLSDLIATLPNLCYPLKLQIFVYADMDVAPHAEGIDDPEDI